MFSAREFVDWYNGLPDAQPTYTSMEEQLRGSHSVSIIGQGNVAVDVARILLSPIDALRKTDITERALNALAESSIRSVNLIGRRGPLQAAFTIKELREMLKLPGVQTSWRANDFDGIDEEYVKSLARPKKRITELMLQSLKAPSTGEKVFSPMFFRSPKEISRLPGSSGKKLVLTVNRLSGSSAVATDECDTLETDLIFRSIGYKGLDVCDPCDNLPFDETRGIVPNERGRVLRADRSSGEKYETGLYVSGWLGTGPIGVILTTMSNSFAVAETLCTDWKQSKLDGSGKKGLDLEQLEGGITWDQWLKIDAAEVANGAKVGKPREKFLNTADMLSAAK